MNDIKDNTPNQETIEHFEGLLKAAKAGEIRSYFSICGWNDDSVSRGFNFDNRNSTLRFLGDLSLATAEIQSAMIVSDPDTQLHQAIKEWYL